MRKRLRWNTRAREQYLDGMRRYQKQGVRILIDGEAATAATWEKIFELREDGGFYMGDYIFEDEPAASVCTDWNGMTVVRETASYGARKRLKEIHFDLVYNR